MATASKTRKLTSAAALLLTFVYSELERKGEVIEVLFDGRDEVVDVPADGVRKVSTRQS